MAKQYSFTFFAFILHFYWLVQNLYMPADQSNTHFTFANRKIQLASRKSFYCFKRGRGAGHRNIPLYRNLPSIINHLMMMLLGYQSPSLVLWLTCIKWAESNSRWSVSHSRESASIAESLLCWAISWRILASLSDWVCILSLSQGTQHKKYQKSWITEVNTTNATRTKNKKVCWWSSMVGRVTYPVHLNVLLGQNSEDAWMVRIVTLLPNFLICQLHTSKG